MAAFCHFWRMHPRDVDRLTFAEYNAMVQYMNGDTDPAGTSSNRRR